MTNKKWWTVALVTLTLMAGVGIFFYQGKPYGQTTDLAGIDVESLQPPGDQINVDGTSSEEGPGNQEADAVAEKLSDRSNTENTYDNAESSPIPAADQSAANQLKDKGNFSSNQTTSKTTVNDPPARSGSIYNQLSPNKGIYGQFHYRELGGGRIEIDPQWVAKNIVTINLPGLNRTVQVNRAAKDKFILAFNYIKNGTAMVNGKEVSLLSLVRTMDGTFVSRHANWNPNSGLSNHSWGTAIDINASDHYRYVAPSESNDPNRILWEKAFKPAGFSWGNSYADSMHFELLDY